MSLKFPNIFILFLIGALAGILGSQVIWPYLSTWPYLSRFGVFQKWRPQTTIINRTEKIVITENTSFQEGISQVSPSVVNLQSYQKGKLLKEGSGFVLTSDGLIVSSLDLIPTGTDKIIVWGQLDSSQDKFISLSGQVIDRSFQDNLFLLKIEKTNLKPVSLAEQLEDISLGERVALVGIERKGKELYYFVNLGTIRAKTEKILYLNLKEDSLFANGSLLLNERGEVLGLNLLRENYLEVVPAYRIKKFLEKSLKSNE